MCFVNVVCCMLGLFNELCAEVYIFVLTSSAFSSIACCSYMPKPDPILFRRRRLYHVGIDQEQHASDGRVAWH